MIDTLMKHLGNDEKVLIKMIKTAKASDDSNMIVPVHTIEKELIGKWAVAREPLSSVSSKLGTTNADKEHADELGLVKQMALIKQMKYSDSMLSELLIAAKKNPSTEKAATDLQNQLIRAWLEKLEPPENVFKFLMLDRAADNVLSDSQLKLWINYAYAVRKRTGKPQVSLIDNLMNNYNDKAMVKIINTAKKSPDAKAKGTYVEDELLLKWAVDEKPIAYVSKMLGTTAAESYSKTLDGFKGVHDKQLRNMLYKHERPQTVFNYLKLDKTDNPFTSPQLNDWVNYATAFKGRTKGNPFAPETNMIDTLMKHIGNDEKVLIKMIKTAKGSDDSNMIVPVHTIEKELIGKWAVAREPLSSVSTKLGTTNADKERLHKIYMDALEEYDTTYLDWMRRYGQ
ncbi:RxLR effector protein, partial [Phytophthora megakarya]